MRRIVATMLTLLGACPCLAQERPFEQKQDVVYGEIHGTGLLMDIFTPTHTKNGLAIVDVASGAWHSDRGKIRDHMRAQFYDIFCGHGYTVFAIRPGSRTRYAADEMVENVKTGIRWVKTHAADYGIDPQRIGLTGASAGGHIALLTTVTPDNYEPTAEKPSTHVAAAGVFFPPTDFINWGGQPANLERLENIFYPVDRGAATKEELADRAAAMSPARQVKPGLPPYLLIHGDADPMVPLQQSQVFVEAVKQAGGSAELIIKPGGAHPWPTINEEVAILADWFDKQLGARKP